MSYPSLLRQPQWVLQSASADRDDQLLAELGADEIKSWQTIKPGWEAFQAHDAMKGRILWTEALNQKPPNLLLQRAVNKYQPDLLKIPANGLQRPPQKSRIAVIIPGELRCIKYSQEFFHKLSKYADLFICTNKKFKEEAFSLKPKKVVFEDDVLLQIGAMHQWFKLAATLSLVRSNEKESGKNYTHIIKLRTDFHHLQPKRLLRELVEANGIICASDKVFGGSRELILLFEGFFAAIQSTFYNQGGAYWPININPILRSDDSSKWYGMSFPKALIGEPQSVESLRHILTIGGSHLANELLTWRDKCTISKDNYVRFFKGDSSFASEICFARFLNFNYIPTKTCSGLTGFLRSDRFT